MQSYNANDKPHDKSPPLINPLTKRLFPRCEFATYGNRVPFARRSLSRMSPPLIFISTEQYRRRNGRWKEPKKKLYYVLQFARHLYSMLSLRLLKNGVTVESRRGRWTLVKFRTTVCLFSFRICCEWFGRMSLYGWGFLIFNLWWFNLF